MAIGGLSIAGQFTISSTSTTKTNYNTSPTVEIGRYYRFRYSIGGAVRATVAGVATSGNFNVSASFSPSDILGYLNSGNTYNLLVTATEWASYSDYTNGKAATDATSTTKAFTVAVPVSNVSIDPYSLDSGGPVRVSWKMPTSHTSSRARVSISVNGSPIFTRTGFVSGSMSYTPTSQEAASMLSAMTSSSPRTITATVTGGFIAGTTTYNASPRTASANITKTFAQAATVGISGTIVLPTSSFSGVTITQPGSTSGITYNLTLSVGGTNIASLSGATGAGSKTFEIDTSTAANKLALLSGSSMTVTCSTYHNGTLIGTNSATGGLIRPAYPTGLTMNSLTVESAGYSYSRSTTGYTYKIQILAAGALISTETVTTTTGTLTFTAAEILNRMDNTYKTSVQYKLLTYDGSTLLNTVSATALTFTATLPTFSLSSNSLSIQGSDISITRGTTGTSGLKVNASLKVPGVIKTWSNIGSTTSTAFSNTDWNNMYSALGTATSKSVSIEYSIMKPNNTIISTSSSSLTISAQLANIATFGNTFNIGGPISVTIGNHKSLLTYKIRLTKTPLVGSSHNYTSSSTSITDLGFAESLLGTISSGSTSVSGVKVEVGTFYGTTQIGSWSSSSTTSTGSVSASTISAPSSITLHDQKLTIQASNSFPNFKHKFKFTIGGQSIDLDSDIISSSSFTLDFTNFSIIEKVYQKITASADTVTLKVDLETYYNTTKIGSTATANVSLNVKKGTINNSSARIDQSLSFIFSKVVSNNNLTTKIELQIPNNLQTLDVTDSSSASIDLKPLRLSIAESLIEGELSILVPITLKTYYGEKQIGSSISKTATIFLQVPNLTNLSRIPIEEEIEPFYINITNNIFEELKHELKFYVSGKLDPIKTITMTSDDLEEILFSTTAKEHLYNHFENGSTLVSGEIRLTTYFKNSANQNIKVGSSKNFATSYISPNFSLSSDSSFIIESPFTINLNTGSTLIDYELKFYYSAETEPFLELDKSEIPNLSVFNFTNAISNTIYNKMNSKTIESIKIGMSRYYDGDQKIYLGTQSSVFIMAEVDPLIVPSASGVVLSDLGNITNAEHFGLPLNVSPYEYFEAFIEGISVPKLFIGSISGNKYSTIKRIRIFLPGLTKDIDYDSPQPVITDFVEVGSLVGAQTVESPSVVVIDSRDRSITVPIVSNLKVIPYERPQLSEISLHRALTNESNIPQINLSEGIYALLSYVSKIAYLPKEDNSSNVIGNFAELKIEAQKIGEPTRSVWQVKNLLETGDNIDSSSFEEERESFLIESVLNTPREIPGSEAYIVYISIRDLFKTSIQVQLDLPTIVVPLSISQYGIAIKEIRTGDPSDHIDVGLIVNSQSLFKDYLKINTEEEVPPFDISSSAMVPRLNVEYLGGKKEDYFINTFGGEITGILSIQLDGSGAGDLILRGISAHDLFTNIRKTLEFNQNNTILKFNEGSTSFVELQNNQIIFKEGGLELMTITNQNIFSLKQIIQEELQIAGFKWIPRANGMALTKV